MIHHDYEQNSPDWFHARLGIPTSSSFDKIVTSTGELSKQAETYSNRLLAEQIIGMPIEAVVQTDWMERGNLVEGDAVAAYELLRDVEAVKVGFITDDARTMGCSPDRLIGDDGLLEVKVPAPQTHVKYLLEPDTLARTYRHQWHGQLLVTGRKWVDLMSYSPAMPPVIMRLTPEPSYYEPLQRALRIFIADLADKRQELLKRGCSFPDRSAEGGGYIPPARASGF